MALTINLTGKVALVTGASSGLGLGIARQLLAAGASVLGVARSREEADGPQAFLAQPGADGANARYAVCDVCEESDVANVLKIATDSWGRLDIVVSNAGVNRFFGAANCTEEQWLENINLNLASHWRLARMARPLLEKSAAPVIEIITSNQGFAAIPGCFPYNIAKTALTGLVRALAVEWGPAIRTVGLAPGFIETSGNDKWFESFSDPVAERQRTIGLHPAGRLGTADEIGAWTAFLASELAAFATGTTFVVDGGRLALLQDPA